MKNVVLSLLCLSTCVWADARRLTVLAPVQAKAETYFTVEYVVDTTDVADFHIDRFAEFFLDVMHGPQQSKRTTYHSVNGKSWTSYEVVYTYQVMCKRPGTYEIPKGYVTIGGEAISSNSRTITITEAEKPATAANGGRTSDASSGKRRGKEKISVPTFRVQVETSKRRVYEMEPFELQYRIKAYNTQEAIAVGGQRQSEGYRLDTIKTDDAFRKEMEKISPGYYRTFLSRVWKYAVTPTATGMLHLPAVTFDVAYDGYDVYANTQWDYGVSYDTVRSSRDSLLKAERIAVEVRPLPRPLPENFSNGIGENCIVDYSLDVPGAKVGDTVKLRIEVYNIVNAEFVKDAVVEIPKGFSVVGKKVNGHTIEYLLIPRRSGTYKIRMPDFTYFDLEKAEYTTVTPEAYSLVFDKSTNGYRIMTSEAAIILVDSNDEWVKWVLCAVLLATVGFLIWKTVDRRKRKMYFQD